MDLVLEKLTKVLDLEREQGFTDSAVIGGLAAFLAHWRSEAEVRLPDAVVRRVLADLADYAGLAADARRARVASVVALARSGVVSAAATDGVAHPAPAAEPGSPGGDRPLAAGGAPEAVVEGSLELAAAGAVPVEVAAGASEAPAADEPDRAAARDGETQLPDDLALDQPVIQLRGFGKKAAENLSRLGIDTIRDLLHHAPHRYNDFRRLKTINQLEVGEEVTIVGTVWDVRRKKGRSGRDVVTVILSDTTATIGCTFFNQPYLEREFQVGRRIVVSGRVEHWAGRLVFQSPEWERLDQELVHTARLVPVYPLTQGVTQRWLRGRMRSVVEQWAGWAVDPLPSATRERHGLISLPDALRGLHFPRDEANRDEARGRLAFDELLTLQLWARQRRRARRARRGVTLAAGRAAIDQFASQLPFTLTGSQVRALAEIADDLSSEAPMSRLLQGDVGSGKTAVAAGAIAMAVAAGAQAAIMAPTEILAEQHFVSLGRLLEPWGYRAFDPDAAAGASAPGGPVFARLVGSMRPPEKATVVEAVASGAVDLLIGTHALIQEGVAFQRLGLAIIDEQHRFGVIQRAELPQKVADSTAAAAAASAADAPEPHVLIMTATPIPRTLAMVINADLDQSVIDELPPGRKPVRTLWLRPSERERAYQFIRARVERGQQAYIVYPLIEASESIDARSAVDEHERLRTVVFPDLAVGLVHGRISAAEKEEVMAAFHRGAVQVLVATSVIEVGVDVPNATVMLIDGADRFGLAQLHQFRGRVGRGEVESACLLLADDPSPAAEKRLGAIVGTSDGLVLAELDLEMRGPGDYFGVQQSGVVDRFRFARSAPPAVLALAQKVADEVTRRDPELVQRDMAGLRERVASFGAAAERA